MEQVVTRSWSIVQACLQLPDKHLPDESESVTASEESGGDIERRDKSAREVRYQVEDELQD